MDIEKWKLQSRKGLIELLLLNLINQKKSIYGLEIIEFLAEAGLDLSEGTLYPLLTRLTKEGTLKPKWVTENTSGHPRKYYELTAAGKNALHSMNDHWQQMIVVFDSVKG
ncbi:MAG: helix-turn-helix transcriptional regulator [Deltaproteobacteria bacterium]|nr:helix-turn-helix transcriptional regulator [Deltaproteobacteria bacterium]